MEVSITSMEDSTVPMEAMEAFMEAVEDFMEAWKSVGCSTVIIVVIPPAENNILLYRGGVHGHLIECRVTVEVNVAPGKNRFEPRGMLFRSNYAKV